MARCSDQLRGAVVQLLPRPFIRPIDAGQGAYSLFYHLVAEVFQVLDLALHWVTRAAALLLTVFLFCALAWTAIFTVWIFGDMALYKRRHPHGKRV
jgi:hypothetical protein